MRTFPLVFFPLAVVATLAACGGGGGGTLTAAQYRHKANAICKRLDQYGEPANGTAAEMLMAESRVLRQGVSALKALRPPLEIYRAAHDLARGGHDYRFGGGHGKPLPSIQPGEPLDCASAASLLLHRAGLFETPVAFTSSRFAEQWGEPGEGRYVTLWANEEHVWIEFNLDHDHAERFDPTPLGLAPGSPWLSSRDLSTRGFSPRHSPGL